MEHSASDIGIYHDEIINNNVANNVEAGLLKYQYKDQNSTTSIVFCIHELVIFIARFYSVHMVDLR